jgi:DNA-binding transcriptional ArsR family regulator
VLREVGAVQAREEGRQRLYRVDAEALRPIFDWVSRYQRLWEERFERLDDVLEELKKEEKEDDDD